MNKVLITADHVLTGRADQVIRDGAVLVDAGVITAVGTAAELEATVDPGVRRVRCPGATVLPGLIDCHVHLAFDAGPDPVRAVTGAAPDELAAAMADRAVQLLGAGVTTVRDLGDREALTVALRASIASGKTAGPRILAATAPLTPPGGHCGFLGGEVTTDDDIRRQIARNAAAGADLIKVMASGGALTPGGPRMWESQFTRAQLRLIVEEAAGHGLEVAAHAHGTAAIADCVDAGVWTLEHCSCRTHNSSPRRSVSSRTPSSCRRPGGRRGRSMPLSGSQWGRYAHAPSSGSVPPSEVTAPVARRTRRSPSPR